MIIPHSNLYTCIFFTDFLFCLDANNNSMLDIIQKLITLQQLPNIMLNLPYFWNNITSKL